MARKKPSKMVWIDGVKVHHTIETAESSDKQKYKSCEFFTLPPSYDSKGFRNRRNIKHGPFKMWNSKGLLTVEIHYNKGVEHGLHFFVYYIGGHYKKKRNVFLNMNNGIQEGEDVEYDR